MNPQRNVVLLASASLIACLVASPAQAAASGSNCAATQEQKDLAGSSLSAKIGLTIAEKSCQVGTYLKRVLSSEDDPEKITPADVLEAEKPQLDPYQQHVRDEFLAKENIKFREEEARSEYLRSNPANEAVTAAEKRDEERTLRGEEVKHPWEPDANWRDTLIDEDAIVIPPATPDGQPTIIMPDKNGGPAATSQPSSLQSFNGEGTVLSGDGVQSGSFQNGHLEGAGEEVSESGTWRAGTFNDGKLYGPAIEIGHDDNGGQYAMTGMFDNDSPDGQVTVTYANGSSRRELFDDGLLVSEGTLAEVGVLPKDASPNSPDGNWHVDSYQRQVGGVGLERKDVALLDGTTYIVNKDSDRKMRDGMMLRVFGDGTVQYEEWKNGKRLQTGSRGAMETTLPPQSIAEAEQTKAAPPKRPSGGASSAPANSESYAYSSVCERNYEKVQQTVIRMGGVDYKEGMRAYSAYMQLFQPCRASDPKAAQDYDDIAGFLRNAQARGDQDQRIPANDPFFDEVNKALGDPNYSADLGSAKGASGGSQSASASAGHSATDSGDGTWVGDYTVSQPVLPADFDAKYNAHGLAPAVVSQQVANDPFLKNIKAQIDASSDVQQQLKYTIALLEGMIDIYSQSNDVPGAKQELQGYIQRRDDAIRLCQARASNPADCTAPMH